MDEQPPDNEPKTADESLPEKENDPTIGREEEDYERLGKFQAAVRKCYRQIVDNLQEHLLLRCQLYQDEILTENEYEDLLSSSKQDNQISHARKLLLLLLRKGEAHLEKFVTILDDQGQKDLANDIRDQATKCEEGGLPLKEVYTAGTERKKDQGKFQEAVRKCYTDIVHELPDHETVCCQLYADSVLKQEEYEKILSSKNHGGTTLYIRIFLDILLKKGEKDLEIFLKVIDNMGGTQLVNKIRDVAETFEKQRLLKEQGITGNVSENEKDEGGITANDEPLYMKFPMVFIKTLEDGKLEVNSEVVDLLQKSKHHITVIAIVGKYRTGKSYVLNRFFNKNHGFSLGSDVESNTKGIWLWARPHPEKPDQTLILLDTEGLHDVHKVDSSHDHKLFSLAILLSSCLVYNATGVLDKTIMEELHLITELTEHIKTKTTGEEDGTTLNRYFPSLYFLLRDFSLNMTVDGKPCTEDEYLEDALKSKPGTGKFIREFNEPRDCIRSYFPNRKCYTLCKPIDDDKKLKILDRVPEEEIKVEFLDKINRLTKEILQQVDKLMIDGDVLNGSAYVALCQEYVMAMNKGMVPCIPLAVETVKSKLEESALKEAIKIYKEYVEPHVESNEPTEEDDLITLHTKASDKAYIYFQENLFSKTTEVSPKDELQKIFEDHCDRNRERSRNKCNDLCNKCFATVEENFKASVYFDEEKGLESYECAVDEAKQHYMCTLKKGPMAGEILNLYLEDVVQGQKETIINTYTKFTEKEKEIALAEEKYKLAENKAEVARQNYNEHMLRLQESHTSAMEKQKEESEKKYQETIERYETELKQKRLEYEKLINEGRKDKANEYTETIKNVEKELESQKQEHQTEMKHLENKLDLAYAKLQELQESQGIKDFFQRSECYGVKNRCNIPFGKGVVAVFANFTGDLYGYNKDVMAISEFFEGKLGYEMQVKKNLCHDDFIQALRELQAYLNRVPDVDRLFVILLSHGNENGILMTEKDSDIIEERKNGEVVIVNTEEIKRMFTHNHVPTLQGYPKCFIVQACHGSILPEHLPTADKEFIAPAEDTEAAHQSNSSEVFKSASHAHYDDMENHNTRKKMPKSAIGADILECQASVPGTASYVHSRSGSVYIKEIFNEFDQNFKSKDICDMLTSVNRRVSSGQWKGLHESQGLVTVTQMPRFVNQLTRQLYLCLPEDFTCSEFQ